jgi:hypothetical protein
MNRVVGLGVVMLLVALGMTFTLEERQLAKAHQRAAAAALQAANAEAERDTTREVALANRAVADLMADSARVFERRALQRKQERDALDRALDAERRGRFAMTASVDPARLVAPPTLIQHGGEGRRATFAVRQVPYTVNANVEITPSADSARLEMLIELDPIPIEARLSCGVGDLAGVRRASLVASTPAWARLRFDRVEQAPEVCAVPSEGAQRRRVSFAPLVIGAGRVFGANWTGSWGLFAGTGIRIWD